MSKIVSEGGKPPEVEVPQPNPFGNTMWPWNLMNNAPAGDAQPAAGDAEAKSSSRGTRRKTPADK